MAGGRTIESGPNAGAGSGSPLKDGFVRPFQLSQQEKADLIAFLESLTDDVFINDPTLADPFR
jgi:cytochrome c peroxidase